RHTRFTLDELDDSLALNSVTRDGYRLLLELATGVSTAESADFWFRWQQIESRLLDLAPLLNLIDRRESERRHAMFSPLGPLQALLLLRPFLKR
ncbi:MAG: hypothetical protein ACNA7J_15460, partial [Wenzhouxiangella sp.]